MATALTRFVLFVPVPARLVNVHEPHLRMPGAKGKGSPGVVSQSSRVQEYKGVGLGEQCSVASPPHARGEGQGKSWGSQSE